MAIVHVKGLRGLAAALKKDLPKIVRKPAIAAARRAAIATGHVVVENMPVAFGELRRSVHVLTPRDGARVVADAPHAAAVENGSRPHVVPIDALVRWVKLRGMQGLDKKGAIRTTAGKRWGNTTKAAAFSIATEIKQLERTGHVLSGDHVDINVPYQIAKRIQAAIAKRGTKPHWFMRKALPDARAFLALEMEKALHGGGNEAAE